MTTEPSTEYEPERHLKAIAWMSFIIVCVFLFCSGFIFPFEVVFQVFAGWILYVTRTLPTLSISGEQTLWFLSALIPFSVGLHFVCREFATRVENTEEIWRKRWSLSLVAMLLLLVMSGVCVISITHQAWWMATGDDEVIDTRWSMMAARLSQSKNNLRQIAVAMHNYHETHTLLPPGGTFNKAGQPQHSWVSQLLPFLDQESLYNKIDFHQPWTAESNREYFQSDLYMIQNPGMKSDYDNGKSSEEAFQGYQPSHYAANRSVLNVNSAMKFKEVADGLSNTILAGEVNSRIKPWGDPTNFRDPALGINRNKNGFGGPFIGGAHVLLGDGRARFISEDIDPAILKALSTPSGGEAVGEF